MKLADLSTDQLRRLAKLAKTSFDHLRHLTKGRRRASADKAAAIEAAGKRLGVTLDRGDLCEACHKCPYRKAAKRTSILD